MKVANYKLGYARALPNENTLEQQVAELKKIGCEKVFTDKVHGSVSERPGLSEALTQLRKGDTLVVSSLDRLGRTLKKLIELLKELDGNEIHFISLEDSIDTSTDTGKAVFNIISALSNFESKLLVERTKVGLKAARARGRLGGRPPLSPNNTKVIAAKKMHKENKMGIKQMCLELEVSQTTFYRYINF